MQIKKIIGCLVLLLMLSFISPAQTNHELIKLKTFVTEIKPDVFDSSLNNLSYRIGDNLHYLYPLYQLLGAENKFKKKLSAPVYYDLLSENTARDGDYSSALEYEQLGDSTPVTEVERRQIAKSIQALKHIKQVDARRFISFIAPRYRVIMLNEAYNKPLHRAFAISLMEELYKRGFRYLAMEMLNPGPDQELHKLTYKTGHFTAEPVAGEMVRIALDMGFQLVAYDDPQAAQHSPTVRDSIQASRIFQVLKDDSSARIFVYAGYGHIAEQSTTSDYVPMGMAFKKISGIDPLTIDQTDMTEESNFSYGKVFYETYLQAYPVSIPSIALADDEPQNITGSTLYDLTVIHPKTRYRDSRPDWLALQNRRQPVYIKPSDKNTFFVQAYYQFESFNSKPGQVVPADQTYLQTGKGTYLLYLRRGKYIVIFRDMQYKTLYTQHIEVN
ncbi:MAG TPA: hypothetical protein VFC34_07405 [Puia sp.]|nr:hypothetical protein [Puia sp.]